MAFTACCSSPSTSNREHGPDCSPCLLTGGLHSPDTRSHPTKLKRLCPSCPKGWFASLVTAHFSSFLSYHHSFPHSWCTTYVSFSVQIPYLGFCACEEMGDSGVWQLVDPPILPLTHGPNHSFNWREMLMQDWRTCFHVSSWRPELLNIYYQPTLLWLTKRTDEIKGTSCFYQRHSNEMKQMYSEILLRIEKIPLVWSAQLKESAICAVVCWVFQNIKVLMSQIWFFQVKVSLRSASSDRAVVTFVLHCLLTHCDKNWI